MSPRGSGCSAMTTAKRSQRGPGRSDRQCLQIPSRRRSRGTRWISLSPGDERGALNSAQQMFLSASYVIADSARVGTAPTVGAHALMSAIRASRLLPAQMQRLAEPGRCWLPSWRAAPGGGVSGGDVAGDGGFGAGPGVAGGGMPGAREQGRGAGSCRLVLRVRLVTARVASSVPGP